MLRTALLALLAATTAAADMPADAAWRIGWPNALGPTGNQLPLRTATPLVEDLAQARLAWITAEADFGAAKTGSQTFAGSAQVEERIGPDAVNPPGNWAGVVMADGRVFASSFIPAGPVFTAPFKSNRPYQKGDTPEVPTRFHVAADDTVVCHDAASGRRLWAVREPGGVILAGGKRGGFQVAPAVDGGRVFALGSTGRIFAYDAASGTRLWQADIGMAHASASKALAAALAEAAAGRIVIPDGPDWFTSLVAAEGVVVVPDFTGGTDIGLRGHDAASGALRWQVPVAISRYATPSLWRSDGRTWLLCATAGGRLRLIDPRSGAIAWMLDGLGQNWSSLAPGERTVMVNVRPTAGKRAHGLWGAIRISATGATRAWSLPDEARNAIPTWMDTGARQAAWVRDGRVLAPTEGTKDAPGRILLLDEESGAVLAEAPQRGLASVRELVWWFGDRALVREDHSHGPSRGGRHPILGWTTRPGQLAVERDEGRIGGLDLADFTTAYEVLMHVPLVDGRMFERTVDGRLACYDLRRQPGQTWRLAMDGAQPGMPPLALRVWSDGARVTGAKAWIPDSDQAGLPWTKVRSFAMWQTVDASGLRVDGGRLRGSLGVDFVSHRWTYLLDAGADSSGTWSRTVPALPAVLTATGAFVGRVADERIFPTPWLKDSPWSVFGMNPAGQRTWAIQLDGAVPLGTPRGLTICIDHDGRRVARAAATAFSLNQAWHDVDAAGLRLGDAIDGAVTVVLNRDPWVAPDAERGSGIVGHLRLAGRAGADGTLSGTFAATWGAAWTATGAVRPDPPAP